MDLEKPRLVGPVHIAETRASRRSRIANSVSTSGVIISPASPPSQAARRPRTARLKRWSQEGVAVVGTPDDAIAQIKRVAGQAGRVGLLPATRAQLGEFREHEEVVLTCGSVTSRRRSTARTPRVRPRSTGRRTTRNASSAPPSAPRCRRSRNITKTKRRRPLARKRRNTSGDLRWEFGGGIRARSRVERDHSQACSGMTIVRRRLPLRQLHRRI